MIDAVYRIVEHDGGWAYKLGDVFSETFPNRPAAEAAARRVAEEQRSPGEDEAISWEDEGGVWHEEAARGTDRPNTSVAGIEAVQRTTPAPPSVQGYRSSNPDEPQYLRTATPMGSSLTRDVDPARNGLRSDSVVVMLLTIAFAYLLGIVVGRSAGTSDPQSFAPGS